MQEIIRGHLSKMRVENTDPVSYRFVVDNGTVTSVNELIGQRLLIRSHGVIRCCHCNRVTKKSFNQGYCYPCFQKLASCDRCIMSPELCHYHLGTCREPEWGESHCMQPHIVYLANSTGLKVGITRKNQMPTRWMDQGAIQALPIIAVSSRQLSGLIESHMKEWVADKTNWRKLLKNDVVPMDLLEERARLLAHASTKIDALREEYPNETIELLESEVFEFQYPHLSWPEKAKTYNLDKQPEIEDTLIAVKGQYLIFENAALNIRKFSSYEVSISVM